MSKRLSALIVPIFIPHQGCPHRCVFCDQQRITSETTQSINRRHIEKTLDRAIISKDFKERPNPEVAFYGGTFTGLPAAQIHDLLEAVNPYIRQGLFRSIRVSTRPDALDETLLEAMRNHNVLTIELGAQSMDDEVLTLSKRGHTSEDTISAVKLLRRYGFKVGIQLMPGLPGCSREKFRSTITKTITLHPDMVRLYPALVIHGTELASMYRQGRYRPMTLEEAVETCAESCFRLEAEEIPVIRIGLMSSPSLLKKGQIVAGPWHPAFGFLVRSAMHQKKIHPELPRHGEALQIKIQAPSREIPLVRGYKNQGIKRIEEKTGARVIRVDSDNSVPPGMVRIEKI